MSGMTTGCEDLDSLFSVLDNGCSQPTVRSCRVDTASGKFLQKIKILAWVFVHKSITGIIEKRQATRVLHTEEKVPSVVMLEFFAQNTKLTHILKK